MGRKLLRAESYRASGRGEDRRLPAYRAGALQHCGRSGPISRGAKGDRGRIDGKQDFDGLRVRGFQLCNFSAGHGTCYVARLPSTEVQGYYRDAPTRSCAHGEFPLGTVNTASTCALVLIPRFEPPKFHYLISLSHQHHINHIDEEPVLDHAGHIAEGLCQCVWVGNLAEMTIQNVVSLVGDEGVFVDILAQSDRSAERGNLVCDQRLRERNHLNWHWKSSQHLNLLAGIRNNHDLFGC